MSRTKIVTDTDECLELSRKMLRLGSPIGVDFEGVQLVRLGLVQVRTMEGDIYLFRTGRNPELLRQGGLGEVLRRRDIVKVMHGAGGDCVAIYKEGVAMWGVYDVAIAHKVTLQ